LFSGSERPYSFSPRPQADYVCAEDGTVRDDVLVVTFQSEASGHPILEAALSLVSLSNVALKTTCPLQKINARPRVAPVTVSPNTANALRQVYATDVVLWEAAKGATEWRRTGPSRCSAAQRSPPFTARV